MLLPVVLLLLVGPAIYRQARSAVRLPVGRRDASLMTPFPGSFAAQVVERGRDAAVRSIAWAVRACRRERVRAERTTGEEFLCDVH